MFFLHMVTKNAYFSLRHLQLKQFHEILQEKAFTSNGVQMLIFPHAKHKRRLKFTSFWEYDVQGTNDNRGENRKTKRI